MTHTFFTKRRAYLDWASAAPVHSRAKDALVMALEAYGNPSSPHDEGRKAKELLTVARTKIARLAGAKARSVIFTSGATEANALAIQGRIKALHAKGLAYEEMHVLYLPTMHSSVVKTVEELSKKRVRIEEIPLLGTVIDFKALAMRIRPETILVCVDAVCGETGIRFDTLGIRKLLDASNANSALLHVDASQLPLIDSIERTHLGADLLTLDAQKVGGVRGIGALIISDAAAIHALINGGGQEDGLRPGTEPVALAVSFAEALEACSRMHKAFETSASSERVRLLQEIQNAIPSAVITEAKLQAPHIFNISLPGLDTDYVVALLDRDGFAVSTKSACETDSGEGSKAVFAYTGDANLAASTLRISWGPETPVRDLRRLPKALKEITTFLGSH